MNPLSPRYTWRRCWLALLLPLSALAIDPKAKWVRVHTDAVDVFSDGPLKSAVEFAVQYSAFRHTLAEMIGEKARQLPPSTVVLFDKPREFKRLFSGPDGKTELSTVSTEVDGRAVIGQSSGYDREDSLRLAFEFETTWGLRRMGFFLPVWAAQGTGKVFSTVAVKRGVCSIGAAELSALDAWRADPLAWPRFFQVHNSSHEYTEPHRLMIYHSQAWALMHYLWLRDDHGPERFAQLVAALRRTPDAAALETALGVPLKDLNATLGRYAGGAGKRREIRYDDAALRQRLESGPVSLGIVAVHVSDLLFGFGRDYEARQELKAAEAAAGDIPLVKEALARQALRERDADRAVELFREAMAAGSTNPRAFLLSAENWLDQTSIGRDSPGAGGLLADKAIVDARRALELSPANSEGYRILGRAFFLRPEVTAEHVAELTRGIEGGDATGIVRYYRALLFERLQRSSEAEVDLRELMDDSRVTVRLRAEASQRVAQLDYNAAIKHVQQLVAERKFAEALAYVREQQQSPTGSMVADAYQKLERWVRDAEKRAAGTR